MTVQEYDFESEPDLENAGKASFGYRSPYIKLPKSGEVLYGKFLLINDGTRRPYIPAPYHEFMVGDDPAKDTRMHFCLKMKDGSDCPRCEEFWSKMKSRKALRDAGKEGSPEYKKDDTLVKANKVGKGGLFLFVEKGSNNVKILFVKESMLNVLFGTKEDKYRNQVATEGILQKMKAEGLNPYNIIDPKGWLKLYKTGSGLGTQFFAEVEQETVEAEINGKVRKVKQEVERKVPDSLIENIKKGNIPNILEVVSGEHEMWTIEECKDFVRDMTVPSRFMKKQRANVSSKSKPVDEEDGLTGDVDFSSELTSSMVSNKKESKKAVVSGDTDEFDDLF
jgi:hypothetical protein